MSEQLEKEVKNFDFVDIETLNVYLDDQKRILPRRVTELSIRNQRRLKLHNSKWVAHNVMTISLIKRLHF